MTSRKYTTKKISSNNLLISAVLCRFAILFYSNVFHPPAALPLPLSAARYAEARLLPLHYSSYSTDDDWWMDDDGWMRVGQPPQQGPHPAFSVTSFVMSCHLVDCGRLAMIGCRRRGRSIRDEQIPDGCSLTSSKRTDVCLPLSLSMSGDIYV